MSWLHDYLLSEALDGVVVSGSGGRPVQLIPVDSYLHNTYGSHTHAAIEAVTPWDPPDVWATQSTYEVDGVYQTFYQFPSAPTSWSLADFTFLTAWSAYGVGFKSNPAVIPLFTAWGDSLDAQVGGDAGEGWVHIITKEGWLINGVSYPSVHLTIEVR